MILAHVRTIPRSYRFQPKTVGIVFCWDWSRLKRLNPIGHDRNIAHVISRTWQSPSVAIALSPDTRGWPGEGKQLEIWAGGRAGLKKVENIVSFSLEISTDYERLIFITYLFQFFFVDESPKKFKKKTVRSIFFWKRRFNWRINHAKNNGWEYRDWA